MEKQLRKMKKGKAIGPDGILAEMWTNLREEKTEIFLNLMNKVYLREKMPEQ